MNQRRLTLLPERDRRAVETFVESVWQTYPNSVQQTILFGSKARGDSHVYSDIDILLIVNEEDWRFRHAISGIAADVSLADDVLIGPRVISQGRWARMRDHRFTFYENVQAEGIELLARVMGLLAAGRDANGHKQAIAVHNDKIAERHTALDVRLRGDGRLDKFADMVSLP